MATGTIYKSLQAMKQNGRKGFGVLADPDKLSPSQMGHLAYLCNDAGVDYLLVGGSLLLNNQTDACIQRFKAESNIPVVLFPGSPMQVSPYADALLYLSLISGRNPDMLIGQHVISAPAIKAIGIEVMSTGYMIIDGGKPTAVSYISNTTPIPADKPDIALCTAWAGELLGQHCLYMDAGSGAYNAISEEMIQKVASQTAIPLFVGGGITSPESAYRSARAGATIVVVGNAIEKDPLLIKDIAEAVKSEGKIGAHRKG